MFVLGHMGVTAAVVHRLDRNADLRLPMLLSILPDLLDKPGRWLWPELVNNNSRGLAHGWLGAAAVLAVLLATRRRAPLLLLACYAGHFLLDRMWLNDDLSVLLWPFRGGFPPPIVDRELSWPLLRWNLLGEAVGFILLIDLARRRGGPPFGRWSSPLRPWDRR